MASKKRKKHDGKPVPPKLWGRDHTSTLLYVETRCVDYQGVIGAVHMRSWPGRPLRGDVGGPVPSAVGGRRGVPTRLADGTELSEHDDWDCVEDMVAAGLIKWEGTGMQPILVLTDKGWRVAHRLRRLRAERSKMPSLQDMIGEVA